MNKKLIILFIIFLIIISPPISFSLSLQRMVFPKTTKISDELISQTLKKTGDFFITLSRDFTYQKAVSANFVSPPKEKEIPVPKEPEKPTPTYSPTEKTIASNSGNVSVNDKITIKNQTSYSIDTKALAEKGIPFTIGDSSSPQVLILHTHATESFTPSKKFNFTYTSNTRTTDSNYNVVRVGSELAQLLRQSGVNVIHDTTLYDYPNYNSSYDNAFYGIKGYLSKYPSISIVIDLHRDAVNTETGETVKLVGDVNGEKAAQLMFVVGTDECGFSHPDWQYNLKFASMIQKNLYDISPNLVRPIMLRTSRFNQHFTKGSLIIEVGTNGNTLDEALLSAKYLSLAIKNTINSLSAGG